MNRSATQHRRQLAAIMFTDIEGYSSLMQKNEERAIQWRTRHRETLETRHQQFEGRIIQFYGDGTLARVPAAMQLDLTRWAQSVELAELPQLASQRGLAPEGLSR